MIKKPEKPQDKSKRKRNRELNDIRVVLSTPEGRRFIWRIITFVRIFKDAFFRGDTDTTLYNTGRKSVGLWVLDEVLYAKPDAFGQMQREHLSEYKREAIENEEYVESKDILKTDT